MLLPPEKQGCPSQVSLQVRRGCSVISAKLSTNALVSLQYTHTVFKFFVYQRSFHPCHCHGRSRCNLKQREPIPETVRRMIQQKRIGLAKKEPRQDCVAVPENLRIRHGADRVLAPGERLIPFFWLIIPYYPYSTPLVWTKPAWKGRIHLRDSMRTVRGRPPEYAWFCESPWG